MWKSKTWREQKRSLIMSCKNFITTNIAALCCVSFMAFVGCSSGSNSVAADTEGKIEKKDPLLSDVKINIEDPVAEIAKQLVMSIADKVDIDFLSTLNGIAAGNTFSNVSTVMDISDSLELFGEDIDGQKALLVSPSMYTMIRNTKDWAPASEFSAGALVRGAVGQIFGCDIMVSNRLTASQNAYIVKPGALRLVLKRDTLLEADRDILRRVNVYTATKHYVTYLYNAANAIKLTRT